MKIEKLYMISQFVTHMALSSCTVKQQWDYTEKYNDFLKQPLKKEMFVNELEKPAPYVQCNGSKKGCSCDKCMSKF